MHFFHYTSRDNLESIFRGDDRERTGLLPKRRFIPIGACPRDLHEKATEGAIFGLLDPLDHNWCGKTYLPDEPLLETVLGDIFTHDQKLYLLRVNLTKDDGFFIADHSPHMCRDYDGWRGKNKKVTHEVKRAYWNSLIPFAKYKQENIAHEIPEVICFSPIPLENISVIQSYNKFDLINEVRFRGGFSPHPSRPETSRRDEKGILKLLDL